MRGLLFCGRRVRGIIPLCRQQGGALLAEHRVAGEKRRQFRLFAVQLHQGLEDARVQLPVGEQLADDGDVEPTQRGNSAPFHLGILVMAEVVKKQDHIGRGKRHLSGCCL